MNANQTAEAVTAESLVQDVIGQHPQTILVFVHHGLQCAGCYMSPYHTIADSAREYQIGVELLLGDLNRAIVENAR